MLVLFELITEANLTYISLSKNHHFRSKIERGQVNLPTLNSSSRGLFFCVYSYNKYTLTAYSMPGIGFSVVDKGDEIYILMLNTF